MFICRLHCTPRAHAEALVAAIVRVRGGCGIRGQIQLRQDSTDKSAPPQNAAIEIKRELAGFLIQHGSPPRMLIVFRISRDQSLPLKLRPVVRVAARVIFELAPIFAFGYRTTRNQQSTPDQEDDAKPVRSYYHFLHLSTGDATR